MLSANDDVSPSRYSSIQSQPVKVDSTSSSSSIRKSKLAPLNRRRSSGVLNRIFLNKKKKLQDDKAVVVDNTRGMANPTLSDSKHPPSLPFSRIIKSLSSSSDMKERERTRDSINISQSTFHNNRGDENNNDSSSKPCNNKNTSSLSKKEGSVTFPFVFDPETNISNDEPLSPTHFSFTNNTPLDAPMTPYNDNESSEMDVSAIQTPPSYVPAPFIVSAKLLGVDVRSKSKNRRKSVKNELLRKKTAGDESPSQSSVPVFNFSNHEELKSTIDGKENLEPLLPTVMFPSECSGILAPRSNRYNALDDSDSCTSENNDKMASMGLPILSKEEETHYYWDWCYKGANITKSQYGCWSANRAVPTRSCLSTPRGDRTAPVQHIYSDKSNRRLAFASPSKTIQNRAISTSTDYPPLSTPKSVKFGEVMGVEFDLEYPTDALTPLAKGQLKLKEDVPDEEEEEKCRETKANTALFAEWEDDFDSYLDDDDCLSLVSFDDDGNCVNEMDESLNDEKQEKSKKKKSKQKKAKRSSSGRRCSSRGGRRESHKFVPFDKVDKMEESPRPDKSRDDFMMHSSISPDINKDFDTSGTDDMIIESTVYSPVALNFKPENELQEDSNVTQCASEIEASYVVTDNQGIDLKINDNSSHQSSFTVSLPSTNEITASDEKFIPTDTLQTADVTPSSFSFKSSHLQSSIDISDELNSSNEINVAESSNFVEYVTYCLLNPLYEIESNYLERLFRLSSTLGHLEEKCAFMKSPNLNNALLQQLLLKDDIEWTKMYRGFYFKEMIEECTSALFRYNANHSTTSKEQINIHKEVFYKMPFSLQKLLCDSVLKVTWLNWKELEISFLENIYTKIGHFVESVEEELTSCESYLCKAMPSKDIAEKQISDETNKIKLLENIIDEKSKELQLVVEEKNGMSSALNAAKAATNNVQSQVKLVLLNNITYTMSHSGKNIEIYLESTANISNYIKINSEKFNINKCSDALIICMDDEDIFKSSPVAKAIQGIFLYNDNIRQVDTSHDWLDLLRSIDKNQTNAIGKITETIGRIHMLLHDVSIVEKEYATEVFSDATEFYLKVSIKHESCAICLTFHYDLSSYQSLLCCLPINVKIEKTEIEKTIGDSLSIPILNKLLSDSVSTDCNALYIKRCCEFILYKLSTNTMCY